MLTEFYQNNRNYFIIKSTGLRSPLVSLSHTVWKKKPLFCLFYVFHYVAWASPRLSPTCIGLPRAEIMETMTVYTHATFQTVQMKGRALSMYGPHRLRYRARSRHSPRACTKEKLRNTNSSLYWNAT